MNNKLFASLAVFRELYNNEKDIYDVLSNFVLQIIVEKSLFSFDVEEMRIYLNEHFDFQLPNGIIKVSIKRLECISIKNGKFVVDNSITKYDNKVSLLENKLNKSYNSIINGLQNYVEKKIDNLLSLEQKGTLEKEFSSFLLDNTLENGYSDLISSFIVNNEENEDFMSKLNQIKEGIILYTGLKFTPNINEIGSWKSKITIYLDVEILFHLSGYNGKVFKRIFDDFFDLVKDVNKKAHLITLKYFSLTKSEVDNFFKKAEYIVSGQDRLNPSIVAMNSIVDGCSSKADVLEKQTMFYSNLKKLNIIEEDYTIEYSEGNYEYNVIDRDLELELLEKYDKETIDNKLKLLNYISIKRESKSINNFENIGVILLSGNSKTLHISWHDNVKKQGEVPLATTIDFLTNKLWFKLNKGFGENDYPKTFSIITKAQIVLSSHINDNLNKQFNDIQNKISDKKITENDLLDNLLFLKDSIKKPEDVESNTIDNLFQLLSENSVEEIVNHHEYLKKEVVRQTANKESLENELRVVNDEVKIKNDKIIETNKLLLNQKIEHLDTIKSEKRRLDSVINSKYKNFKIILLGTIIFYYLTIGFLIYKFGWDTMEQFAWILGTLPFAIGLINFIAFEEELSIRAYLENKKNSFKKTVYEKNNFNESKIEILNTEINELIR